VLRSELEARGLSLDKYKKAPNVTYAKISNRFTTMKLEMSEKNIEHKVVKKYEKVDGSYIDIYTLSAEDLIVEKMNAFLNRRFIRDIYDVYHLSSIVDNSSNGVSGKLNYLPEPIDEKNLKTLVYSGVAPSYKEMVKTIRRRFG
jgi:predicted nucleotidyltransferase component of viral defense system